MATTVPSCIFPARYSIWLLIPIVVHARIEIFPIAPVVEVGSDIAIHCTVLGDSHRTAHDLVWFHDTRLLSRSNYSTVNNNVSVISLKHVGIADSGKYSCCFHDECSDTRLSVGVRPGPLSDFRCMSRNMYEYWCEWQPGNDTHLPVSYEFKFKRRWMRWEACPDSSSKGVNTCFIPFHKNHGSEQKMRVISTNELGSHIDCILFNPDTQTIPHPPSDVVVTPEENESIRVSWGFPDDWMTDFDHGTGLNYKLRYKSDNSVEWIEKILESSERSTYLRDLKPYTQYCVEVAAFIITAKSADYSSEWTETKCTTTYEAVPIDIVHVVINATYDSPGNESKQRDVILQWDVRDIPLEAQRGVIIGYVLYVKKTREIDSAPTVYNTSMNKITLHALDKFTEYTVYTHAFNSAGMGPSGTCIIKDLTDKPGPPVNVSAVAIAKSAILIKWREPTQPNGYLQTYTIQWQQHDRRDEWDNIVDISSSYTTWNISGLDTYTTYNFRIRANNKKCKGIWQDVYPITTMEDVLKKPPASVRVANITGNPKGLNVSWQETQQNYYTNGKVLGYFVYGCMVQLRHMIKKNCTGDIFVKNVTDESCTSTIVNDLQPFTSYLIWVAAYSHLGPGPESTLQMTTTSEGAPSKPMNVTITGINASSISLSWVPPLKPNGIIQHYVVDYCNESNQECQILVEGTSCTVSGLNGYQNYTLRVQARTSYTPRRMHDKPFVEVAGQTLIGAPGEPNLLEPATPSATMIKLSWDPPTNSNGPVSYYIVEYGRSSRPNRADWIERNVTDTNLILDVQCGMAEDGVMYDIEVSAVNIDESGNILRGPAMTKHQAMCRKIPVLPGILVSLTILIIGVIIYVIFYKLKKSSIFKDYPEPYFKGILKDVGNIRSFAVVEEEIIDEPLSMQPVQATSDAETAPPVQIIDAEMFSSGHSNPLCGSLEQIRSDKSLQNTFGRSDSTDSGVPPSPSNYSTGNNSPVAQDENDIRNTLRSYVDTPQSESISSGFTYGCGQDDSRVMSDSVGVDDDDIFSFCNRVHMQQSMACEEKGPEPVLSDINNNTPGECTANSEADPTVTALSHAMLNREGESLHQLQHGDASDMNARRLKPLAAIPNSQPDNSPYIASRSLPPVSPDDIESAPYFQVGLSSPLPSVVPVARSSGSTDQLPYAQVGQILSNDVLNGQPWQRDSDASVYRGNVANHLQFESLENSDDEDSVSQNSASQQRVELNTVLSNEAQQSSNLKTDLSSSAASSASSYSQMADIENPLLQQIQQPRRTEPDNPISGGLSIPTTSTASLSLGYVRFGQSLRSQKGTKEGVKLTSLFSNNHHTSPLNAETDSTSSYSQMADFRAGQLQQMEQTRETEQDSSSNNRLSMPDSPTGNPSLGYVRFGRSTSSTTQGGVELSPLPTNEAEKSPSNTEIDLSYSQMADLTSNQPQQVQHPSETEQDNSNSTYNHRSSGPDFPRANPSLEYVQFGRSRTSQNRTSQGEELTMVLSNVAQISANSGTDSSASVYSRVADFTADQPQMQQAEVPEQDNTMDSTSSAPDLPVANPSAGYICVGQSGHISIPQSNAHSSEYQPMRALGHLDRSNMQSQESGQLNSNSQTREEDMSNLSPASVASSGYLTMEDVNFQHLVTSAETRNVEHYVPMAPLVLQNSPSQGDISTSSQTNVQVANLRSDPDPPDSPDDHGFTDTQV